MRTVVYILIATGLLTAGCIFSSSDKKEDDSRPGIKSISLTDKARVKSRDLTVTWRGNARARLFRYELDGTASAWSESTSVGYADLAEGGHIFTLIARGDSLIGEPVTRHFTVDVLAEPAIVFSPVRLTGIATVNIGIEGAESLMAAHIEIVCENGSARIFEFTPAASDGGHVVMSSIESASRLVLDVGFTGAAGDDDVITVGSMLVQPVQSGGKILVDPDATLFRDFNNEQVTINGFDEIQVGK